MIVNVILWVGFGALVGWVASLLTRENDSPATSRDVFIGILGALAGGLCARLIGGEATMTSLNIAGLFVALMSAITLLFGLWSLGHG